MNAPTAKQVRKAAYEAGKLEKRLRRLAGQAIADYDMIRAGDRVMVCLSGGKDSYGLLDILLKLREAAPLDFEIVAVNLDQRHPGYPEHVLPEYLARQRVISSTLLKRTGEPDDIAAAVYFLVAEAPYVTGQIVAVDGGRSVSL